MYLQYGLFLNHAVCCFFSAGYGRNRTVFDLDDVINVTRELIPFLWMKSLGLFDHLRRLLSVCGHVQSACDPFNHRLQLKLRRALSLPN